MKFRKKPLVVDAVRWNGRNELDIAKIIKNNSATGTYTTNKDMLYIILPDRELRMNIGDWLIKGVKGELYPCTNEVFEVTYDAVFEYTPPVYKKEIADSVTEIGCDIIKQFDIPKYNTDIKGL